MNCIRSSLFGIIRNKDSKVRFLQFAFNLWLNEHQRNVNQLDCRWQHSGHAATWGSYIRDSDVDKLLDIQVEPVDERAMQDLEDEEGEEEDIFEGIQDEPLATYSAEQEGEGDAEVELQEEKQEVMTIEKVQALYAEISPITTSEQAADLFETINKLKKWDIINNNLQVLWPMLYSTCKYMDRICHGMTTAQIVRGLTVFARTQYCNSPNGGIANRVMVKFLHRRLDQLNVEEMVEAVESLGQSRCALKGISERVCRVLYENVSQLNGQQLKTVVIALHKMDWYEPLLYDALLENLYPKVKELNAIDVADTMFSCAYFRHRKAEFVDAVCEHMSSDDMALMKIHPNQAAELLRACVTLNVRDVIMGRRLLDKVADGARGMKTKAVISTFYAWSMLNFPIEALEEITPRLGRRFHFKEKYLTDLQQWREIFLGYYHFRLQKLSMQFDQEMLYYTKKKWIDQYKDRKPMWLKWRHNMGIPQMERQRIHDICYTLRQLRIKGYECYITKDKLLTVDVATKIKNMRIAFQVLAPADTTVNEPYVCSAREIAYAGILKMRGWFVLFVHWAHWDTLDSDQKRQDYILYKLKRVTQVSGVDLFSAAERNVHKFRKNRRFRQLWE